MSQQQRHQLGLSAEPSTQPGLYIRTGEQQLLAAWDIVQGACSILLLSASPLVSLVLAAHLESCLQEGATKREKQVMRK
jgi:hypothetical protein